MITTPGGTSLFALALLVHTEGDRRVESRPRASASNLCGETLTSARSYRSCHSFELVRRGRRVLSARGTCPSASAITKGGRPRDSNPVHVVNPISARAVHSTEAAGSTLPNTQPFLDPTRDLGILAQKIKRRRCRQPPAEGV